MHGRVKKSLFFNYQSSSSSKTDSAASSFFLNLSTISESLSTSSGRAPTTLSTDVSGPSERYFTLTLPLLITRKATGVSVTPAPPPPPKSSYDDFVGKLLPPEAKP